MDPKRKLKKGTKQLCDALESIRDANIEIAEEALEEGNYEKFSDAIDAANHATDDLKAWQCGKKRASRARKRIAKLSAAIERSRKSKRSGARSV